MEDVQPRGSALPRLGHEVRILVGEPVPVADLMASAREEGWPPHRLYRAVTLRVAGELYRLKATLDNVPLNQVGHKAQQGCSLLSLVLEPKVV